MQFCKKIKVVQFSDKDETIVFDFSDSKSESLRPVKKHKTLTKVLTDDECENMIEEEFDNVFMNGVKTLYLRGYDVCVDEGSTKSVCVGDSGGPLICEGTTCKT